MSAPTVTLPIEKITMNGNVRRDLRLDDGFIASIKEEGILQPILVSKDDKGNWHLIAGARRLAGASAAGLSIVPVHETKTDNIIVTQVIENLHRNDLTPLELAQATWDLKVEGMKQADVASKVGMTVKVVSELQKIGKAVASDEFIDDARLDEMNQMTLTGLVDLVEHTPDEVHIADVVRLYGEEDNQSIRGAVSSAKHDAELAVFYEEIAESMTAWNDAGIETVASDPSKSKKETDQWGNPKVDRKYEVIGKNHLNIDLDKHMELPCHIIQIDDGGSARYGYSQKPRVIHWCKEARIHSHKGKSHVKVVKAEEEFDRKATTLTQTRKVRTDKELRRAQAQAYMSQREAKAKTLDVALEMSVDTMHWDDKKLACQVLEIDGDRPTPTDSSWYASRWNQHLEELFGKKWTTDEKARLYQSRMLVALKHWQDRAWAAQPVVKAAVKELEAIEIVTE